MFQKVKDIPVGPRDSTEKSGFQKLLSQTLWLLSTARNILVVVISALLASSFDQSPFELTGKVSLNLWRKKINKEH